MDGGWVEQLHRGARGESNSRNTIVYAAIFAVFTYVHARLFVLTLHRMLNVSKYNNKYMKPHMQFKSSRVP